MSKNKLKFKKINKFKFLNKDYKILWKKPTKKMANGDAHGLCFPPESKNPRIYVNPEQSELDFLITIIDETIHSTNFTICNEHVGFMSDNIGKFLWDLGFRLKDNEKTKKKKNKQKI